MTFNVEDDNNAKAVDWSCNDMIAVSDCNMLYVYDNNGEKLLSIVANVYPYSPHPTKITDLKWNNGGKKHQAQYKVWAVFASNNLISEGLRDWTMLFL